MPSQSPMTMEAPISDVEYLANEVILNSKAVSYHKFSRQLNIPISKAKKTLYEYYTKNREQVSASFVITGVNKDGIKAVKFSENEEKLKHDMEKFESISTIHVFCVMKKDLNITKNEIALEESKVKSSLSQIKEYERNGIIIGPKFDTVSLQNVSETSPAQPSASPPIRKPEEKRQQQVKSSGLSSSYVSRKQQSQQSKPAYTSRKSEPVAISKRSMTEPAAPSYQYKSRKLEQKQPKERIIMGNLHKEQEGDDVNDDDLEPKREQRPPPTTDLEKIFDGDDTFQFSDEDDVAANGVSVNDNEATYAKPEESNEVSNQSQAEEESKKEEEAQVEPATDEPEEQLFVEDEEQEDAVGDDMETVKEVDEDGYTVTKRKPKSVTKPTRKPAAGKRTTPPSTSSKAKKSTHDGNKKKTQTSLMSFFGKK
ncbi:hypothetical protein CANMA_001788 [Candida margitis]|uniref:uncharacterized protein n=1 Tax=Candida margitis TaxID=1775924 RepID=UPI002227F240|nr:uncharacterized protein CANMA_001788 [Candida margitis]KAI5969121.1 hypothetical protein CANMA_001788 [Candida margitis]